jgi:hypothetical protein
MSLYFAIIVLATVPSRFILDTESCVTADRSKIEELIALEKPPETNMEMRLKVTCYEDRVEIEFRYGDVVQFRILPDVGHGTKERERQIAFASHTLIRTARETVDPAPKPAPKAARTEQPQVDVDVVEPPSATRNWTLGPTVGLEQMWNATDVPMWKLGVYGSRRIGRSVIGQGTLSYIRDEQTRSIGSVAISIARLAGGVAVEHEHSRFVSAAAFHGAIEYLRFNGESGRPDVSVRSAQGLTGLALGELSVGTRHGPSFALTVAVQLGWRMGSPPGRVSSNEPVAIDGMFNGLELRLLH